MQINFAISLQTGTPSLLIFQGINLLVKLIHCFSVSIFDSVYSNTSVKLNFEVFLLVKLNFCYNYSIVLVEGF